LTDKDVKIIIKDLLYNNTVSKIHLP